MENTKAAIYVTNNSSGPAKIELSCEQGSNPLQTWSTGTIPPGGTAGPLAVSVNPGAGPDYWYCALQTVPGGTLYSTEGTPGKPGKSCAAFQDQNTVYCSASTSLFQIEMASGTCTAPMRVRN